MRLLFSLSTFAFTMILSLTALIYTAFHYPRTMRDILAAAQYIRDQISSLGLPDSYMVWVDIFLQPPQLVLVGFSIAMRLAIDIVRSFFNAGRSPASRDAASFSPFSRWGKSL
jgi:hypothetical protein